MARILVLGSSNTDMTVHLPGLPAPGQTVLGGSLLTGPGGKGANQAVAAARAGGDVVFVTSVGDDAFGQASLDLYRRERIDVSHAKIVPGVASGVALIFVNARGENMIGVASGANSHLSPSDIQAFPDDLFQPDTLFLVGGLEVPMEAVEAGISRAKRTGLTVLLNPAPVSDSLRSLIATRSIDILTPNRIELESLTGQATLEDAVHELSARGIPGVVVTLGAEGCLVFQEGELRRIPSHPVVALDTVGAGDAFNGALAVALAEKRPLFEAAAWANAAAALAVTKPGAQAALAERREIDRFARTHS